LSSTSTASRERGSLPNSRHSLVRSRRRTVVTHKGSHFYFKLPAKCGTVPSSADGGLDIRADGGYVIAPPSIHPDGGSYEWDCASPSASPRSRLLATTVCAKVKQRSLAFAEAPSMKRSKNTRSCPAQPFRMIFTAQHFGTRRKFITSDHTDIIRGEGRG
jgi:Bifunctional DNA primase/polymerase, N-terminal